MRGYRNLGFGVVLAAWPAPAYSPDAESVLEFLERRIAGGLAGQEAHSAFLDFLDDTDPAGEAGCEAWGHGSEAAEVRNRHPDLDRAIKGACPESGKRDAAASGSFLHPIWTAPRATGRKALRIRTGITHSAKPRRSLSPSPSVDQEGAIGPVLWKASLRDFRPHARHVELRAGDLSFHAGHLRSGLSRTRLPFVAGGGFYEGWSGTSGLDGALYSPYAALDGLGASLRKGPWAWDAAGTWNRLTQAGKPRAGNPGVGRPDAERRDALLYVAGMAREHKGGKASGFADGPAFRLQAAHQRLEPAAGPPSAVSVAGAALTGFRGRLRLGLAGSLVDSGRSHSARPRPGGYGEFSAAQETAGGGFRFEVRQAGPGWANPLQSPRGYFRDTAGQWFLSGRGQGGASLRARLPVAAAGSYRMSIHPGGFAGWILGREELPAAEGRIALIQEWGPWTHESGMCLRHRGSGVSSSDAGPGWGQTLTWRREGWKAEASFLPRGKGYRGSRPAPVHLTLGHGSRSGSQAAFSGPVSWSAEALLGDVRDPGRYLMLALRQRWDLSGRIRALQGLRLPWEHGELSREMGYQLRLEALF